MVDKEYTKGWNAAITVASERCQRAYDDESAPMVRSFDEAFQACAVHLKREISSLYSREADQ